MSNQIACPRCEDHALEATLHGPIEVDRCDGCAGMWFDRDELSALIEAYDARFPRAGAVVETLGLRVRTSNGACPHCQRPMERYRYDERLDLELDVCESCRGIWLDGDDFEMIHVAHEASAAWDHIESKPRLAHHLFFLFTLLPAEFNVARQRLPVVTLALMGISALVFVTTLASDTELFRHWGLVSAEAATAHWWLTLVTHQFLHAGFWHIAGNMYFLYALGDNVEDVLGRGRFLVFYLAAGMVAGMTHTLLDPEPRIPAVGASGSISAIVGAYVVIFRRARLSFPIIGKIATLYCAALWIVFNLVHALAGSPEVAWWAHVGGFAFGVAVGLLSYKSLLRRHPLLQLVNHRLRDDVPGRRWHD